MKGKRTGIDFSKHILHITQAHNPKVHIADLRLPESGIHRFIFINSMGVMTVAGDYGNYVFNREFHPSPEGSVNDPYWIEKMSISSYQNLSVFDPIETEKEIRENLLNSELSEEDSLFLEDLLGLLDDELSYTYHAYRNRPSNGQFSDCEYIPFCKKLQGQIPFVFDAFDEICRRLKDSDGEFYFDINSKNFDDDNEVC